jgi:D-alanine--poly(phosphoribitol) ligase subunit 2
MAVSSTIDRLQQLIENVLTVEVPHTDTDLVEAGLIDSLGLVTMIAEIEQEFSIQLPLDDFDLDRFRSIERIAEFLAEVDARAR